MSYKKFTKDAGFVFLGQLLTVISGIVTLPIITKSLGAQNYGVWVQLMVTLGLISSFAHMELPYTLVRFLAAEKDKEAIRDGVWSVFSIVLGVCLFVFLFFVLFSGPISNFLESDKILVVILSLVILFECLNQVFYSFIRAFQKVKKYFSFKVAQAMGGVFLIILAILLGYGLLGAILSLLITKIAAFLFLGIEVCKKASFKIPRFLKIKKYLAFSLPRIPENISFWAVQSSDRYVIGFFLGTIFVGYYAPAYTLGYFLYFFMTPMSFLLPATLSNYYDNGQIEKVKIYLKYSLKLFLTMAIPAFFGLFVLSRQLLEIFSTREIARNSYSAVPFIAFSFLLFGIYTIASQVIVLKKNTKISSGIWLAAAFLNIVLNLVFVPVFGIIAAAVATSLSYLLATVLACKYSFGHLKFGVDRKMIFKSIIASSVMAYLVILLRPEGFYKVFFAVVSGALAYGALMILLKAFTKQEFQLLKEMLKRDNRPTD